jgi:uncharacterized protein
MLIIVDFNGIKTQIVEILKTDDKNGHGYDHFVAVHNHAVSALKYEPNLTDEQKVAVELAALLHDIDDKKLFPNNKNNENARAILENNVRFLNDVISQNNKIINKDNELHSSIFVNNLENDENNKYLSNFTNIDNQEEKRFLTKSTNIDDFFKLILHMIDLVSCSKNGDSDPPISWMAIPRDCDRLEAIGHIGIERCRAYNQHISKPLHLINTQRVYTIDELWKVATVDRFNNYQKLGTSESMIDHYYDKLLHIGSSQRLKSKNFYVLQESKNRESIMIDYILNYWKNNQ